jgi:hypothetical protein
MNAARSNRTVRPGDLIEITGHHVHDALRVGLILEVLGEKAAPHFRVRWEDGHESIFYPSSDAIIRPRTAKGR